jgi:hypothetical protein
MLLACPAVAHAEGPVGAIASDDAFRRNVATLLGKDVHFDARFGLWFARLSRGPISSITTTDENIVGLVSADQAGSRIGTGTGTLRDVGISIDVAGNEAYFDYLGNDLFSSATNEATAGVGSPVARTVLRQIAGEFRPNLSKLLGPNAFAFVGAQYGHFEGPIRDAYVFSSYNGTPYFGGRSATWTTEYTAGQAGVMWRSGSRLGNYVAYGVMGRYESFSRPVALGNVNASDNGGGFLLQDGKVKVTSLAARFESNACTGVLCLDVSAWATPLTGLAKLDLDHWGTFTGLPFAGGLDARVGVVLQAGSVSLEPFAGLRAEWLMIWAGSSLSQDADRPLIIPPDYFLWGPMLGIEGHL